MNNKQKRAFPLQEEKDFLSESEWVIFKLLCKPVDSFIDSDADELSKATGGQVSPERCDELIRIVRIRHHAGVGSWIARIFAQAGLSHMDILQRPATEIAAIVNDKLGYPLCNEATCDALAQLQQQRAGTAAS
ncbi:hypothetical protein FE236_07390 [Mariprofundus erugo]|uniref:hypothetical protein n=1 Tax=Mariprofundus erugo TaxID=2528639 RepID=UPI0010FF4EF5|nr:hypothetical protein [Mariprofundus erugo]TLS76202.1 hypothetical protein FE236_07390 [Mariprofundus erugo]